MFSITLEDRKKNYYTVWSWSNSWNLQLKEIKVVFFLFYFILGSELLTELKHFLRSIDKARSHIYVSWQDKTTGVVRVKSGALFTADPQLVCIVMTALA